jgi:hypothetical protein
MPDVSHLGGLLKSLGIPLLVVIAFFVILVPMNSYVKLYRRRQKTKGRMFCYFRKPSGGVEVEMCLVKGKCVYRGQDDYRRIKEPKDALDPRVGHEVYFLKKADDQAFRTKDGRIHSKREWAEMISEDSTLEGEMIATGRPHIKLPLFAGGFWEPQVDIPVAEFVEGMTLEVDCVSVALQEFGADPQYNTAMAGSILDEKMTKLWTWWSEYVEALEKQLAQKINPTVLYMLLGGVAVGVLITLALTWNEKSQIAHLVKQVAELKALLGFVDTPAG